ncbi:MAG TPA: glycosyltransferase family 39 protein [Dongiaceae bacterium]|nr:glycosyltransferase family 39 protein [Dongiaceae bacterium]
MKRRPERAAGRRDRPAAPRTRSAPAFSRDGAAAPGDRTVRMARWALVVLLVLCGGALLAIILGPHKIGDYFTETDFYGSYGPGARALQHGHLDPARYGVVGPVYEIVLALVGFVIRDLFLAAQLVSLVATLVTLWLWARLLERRADIRLGLAAAALMAVNPVFLRYGFSATTDALGMALQVAALAALLTGRDTRAAGWAGVLTALAFLTRYTNGVLIVAGLVSIAAGWTLHAKRRAALLAFAGGVVTLTVPWIAWSLAHGGQFASQLHHNIAYDVFARPQGMVWDDYQRKLQPQFHSLWDVIRRDPIAVARRELYNVWDHLRLDARVLIGWPTAACAAIGVLLLVPDRGDRRLWPVWLAGALAFLALVPAFHSARYSLAILPVYATLAAAAFATPRLALVVGGRVWLKAIAIVAPLALTLTVAQREITGVLQQLPLEALDAGRALRPLAAPGDRIMARKPHVAWIGGVEAVAFPLTDSLETLARAAHEQDVRWLFYASPEAELRPEFSYLLDTSAVVPGLTPRFVSPRHVGVLYEIGRDFGTPPAWISNDTMRVYHRARVRLMLDPNDVRSLRAVAFVDARDGRDTEARALLEHAIALDPSDEPGLTLLGEVTLRLGDAERAADVFGRAVRLAPGDPRANLGLGWALLLAHRPEDAARVWRPLVSATRDPATLRRMAELFERQGDHAAAAEARAAETRARAR